MIEVNKIIHGVEKVGRKTLFSLSHYTSFMKLMGGRLKTDKRK